MTTTEILTGIKNWVVGKLNLKQNVISDLADIRSGAQAGATSVQPADILSYFDNAVYDSGTHRINFYHGQSVIAYIDASPFIIDGMVNDVSIENGYLVIDFNTDSGKQDISIPLTDIFNPNNYYTKSETDSHLTQKQSEIDDLYARIGYYVCSTEGNVAAKTIVANNYTLGNGGSIKIKMTNANTVNNATLNINSTGAKALYYDGERASAKNSWEAGETVEVYYDGTSFYANNIAGGSGSGDGAFDVSAKYPTSGVDGGNTYTLEGALAVLNANLSASKKKGGMSVKYVQTYDNKYIQARCMAQNFTTDVTQWQGVDSKPVDGSHNLLESNGAAPFNSLMPNGYKFYGRIQGYLDSNGTFHSGGTYNCTDYISVTPGIVVTIKEYYDAGTNVAFGYSDKNGSNPVVLLQATSGLLEKDILIPEGVNYVRAWGRNSQEVSIVVDLYTIDSFFENALFDLSRATATLTPNALVATKELLISNYVPSVKIIVPDQGNDVLFDGNFIIGKVSDNSLNVIYSGSINQNTNGRGYIIFTPKIKYTNELNGANIFVSCKGRYIGYSARQADIGANHTLTYSNGVVSEVQTFICGISFIRYTDKSIYTLYQDNNWEEVENVNPEEQDIKTLIESGGTIYLGDKTYIINESISVPTDTHIIGSAKTIIKSNISTPCFIINGADNVKFENITFYGADSYTKPSIPTENDIKNKTGIGAKIGIEFQNISNKAVVSNCIFKNFDNSAIHLRNDNGGSANVDGVKVSNCFFDNCFIGVFADKRYEYCQFTDSSFNKCQIGAWCEAGNNIFNSCHFDTNRCGFVLSGLLNSNEAHSNVGACSFNHNAVCSLFIINVDNAEAFNNCSFFDGKMYIENSYGIIISSSLIAQDAVEIHGGNLIELPKYLSFCNNVFSKSYGFDGFINPDNLSLILKNNFYLDGSNSDNINN